MDDARLRLAPPRTRNEMCNCFHHDFEVFNMLLIDISHLFRGKDTKKQQNGGGKIVIYSFIPTNETVSLGNETMIFMVKLKN